MGDAVVAVLAGPAPLGVEALPAAAAEADPDGFADLSSFGAEVAALEAAAGSADAAPAEAFVFVPLVP